MKQFKWKLCFELKENKSAFVSLILFCEQESLLGKDIVEVDLLVRCLTAISRNFDNIPLIASCDFVSHAVCIANTIILQVAIWFLTLTIHGKWVSKNMMGFDNHFCAQQGFHGWFCQLSRLICCDIQLYYYYKINRTTK